MRTEQEVRDYLLENECEESIIFTNPHFAPAFVGVTQDGCAVYDYNKMIEYLAISDNMSYEDAAEFIEYNTIRSLPYMGSKSPIILYTVEG